jgi:hypothetical protein
MYNVDDGSRWGPMRPFLIWHPLLNWKRRSDPSPRRTPFRSCVLFQSTVGHIKSFHQCCLNMETETQQRRHSAPELDRPAEDHDANSEEQGSEDDGQIDRDWGEDIDHSDCSLDGRLRNPRSKKRRRVITQPKPLTAAGAFSRSTRLHVTHKLIYGRISARTTASRLLRVQAQCHT